MTAQNNIRKRKIYVASSWRNTIQPSVVIALRDAGHEVYDFRSPTAGEDGFAWTNIDTNWLNWTPEHFAEVLKTNDYAAKGFGLDKAALEWCDTVVMVLPCGRSAHLELGYIAGQGKDSYILLNEDKFEPELMYLLNTACANSIQEIIELMAKHQPIDITRWHVENGGNFNKPSSHAIRLLREVVELCMAAGADTNVIWQHVNDEMSRQIAKPDYNRSGNPDDLPEEWADCQILLDVFASHAGIDRNKAVRNKSDILWNRLWKVDSDGVLWRPKPDAADKPELLEVENG